MKASLQAYFSSQKLILSCFQSSRSLFIRSSTYFVGKLGDYTDGRIITNQKKASELLQVLVKNIAKEKKSLSTVDLALPDNYFFSQILPISKTDKIEPDKDYILKKAEEFFPVSTDELYIHWRRLTKEENSPLLLSAIAKKELDPLIALFAENKLHLRSVLPISYLLAHFIILFESNSQDYILQFLVDDLLTTAVSVKGNIVFSSCYLAASVLSPALIAAELEKARKFSAVSNTKSDKKKIYFYGLKNLVSTSAGSLSKVWQFEHLEDKLDFHFKKKDKLANKSYLFLSAFSLNHLKFNLLPEEEQKRYEKYSFLKGLQQSLYFFSLSLLFLVAAVAYFSLQFFFAHKIEADTLNSAKNGKIVTSPRQIEEEASLVNKKVQTLDALYNNKVFAYKIINEFYGCLQSGINITSFDYNVEQKKIKAKGVAYSRADLLAFQAKLNGLGSVSLPITSFVRQKDLPFEVNIALK